MNVKARRTKKQVNVENQAINLLSKEELNKKIEAFKYGSQVVTNYEMESSALAGLAKLMGHKAMTVCSIIANRVAHHANPNYKTAVSDLIQTVLERI